MKIIIVILVVAVAFGHSLPVEEATQEVKTTTQKLEEKTTTTMETTKWTTPKKWNSSESKEDDDKADAMWWNATTTHKSIADGKSKKAETSMSNEKSDEVDMKVTTTTKTSPPSEPVPDAVHVVKKTTIVEEEVKAIVEGCKTPGTKKVAQLGTATPLLEEMMYAAADTVGTSGTGPVIALQLDSTKTWLDEPLIVSTVTRMSDEMQRDAVAAAREGFRLYRENEYLVAKHIVTEFDAKYEPYWHCSAGESYEAYFTFEKDTFIRMSKGKVHLQLYKHFCTE